MTAPPVPVPDRVAGRHALYAYLAVAILVAGMVRIDVTLPLIGHVGSALVAVTLLYAPVVVAWRRREDLIDFGFRADPVGRGLRLGLGYAMGWHRYLSLDFLAMSRDMLKATVADNYAASAAGFAVVYALAVAFSFPAASVLTIFGGFLFGWLVGGTLVAFAATAGATAA